MAEAVAYLDGAFLPLAQARVPITDRGFLFADGAYEVMIAYGGRIFAFDRHLQRLQRSLRELALRDPYPAAQWRAMCDELVRRNFAGGDLMVYVQVTRGAPERRIAAFPADVAPTVAGFCQPAPPPAAAALEAGVGAVTLPDIRWGRCDIKAIALLPNVLAIQAAAEAGCNEAILHRDGRVTEGGSSNVFAVIGGTVVTPPLGPEILPGVTRAVLLELLRADGVPVAERAPGLDELRTASEIWVTSTVRELLPVTRLDGAAVGDGRPGPVWRRTYKLFQECKRSQPP